MPNLRKQDWEHRLGLLSAWRHWRHVSVGEGWERNTYSAVFDGCAITVRALCMAKGVKVVYRSIRTTLPQDLSARRAAYWQAIDHAIQQNSKSCSGVDRIKNLSTDPLNDIQCYFLDVLYLANRAIAHPDNGFVDHLAEKRAMTAAINTLFGWLKADMLSESALEELNNATDLHPLLDPMT